MHLVVVVPARLGSTRLPQKPLRLLAGEPMIRVVARRALALGLDCPVVVAADDERVLAAVADLAVRGVLTGSHHGSGTERVAEVAAMPEFAGADVLVNLQGDEPFVPSEAVVGAVDRLRAGDEVGTAAQPLDTGAAADPHRVKVAVDRAGRAGAFFRVGGCPRPGGAVYQHLGVYAYTPATVHRWAALPETAEERTERLEQLRPLAHGLRIGVATLADAVPHGIDTEDDLRYAEALL